MFTTSKDDTECGELKNIQYQTMLLNGAPENICGTEDNVNSFQDFIDHQREADIYKPWSKLEKMVKITCLERYVDNLNDKLEIYKEGDTFLSNEKKKELKNFLKTELNRKKLQRVKDVVYDKDKGAVQDIPGLSFNKKRNFTLKKDRKNESSLKSLTTKTNAKTVKAKHKKVASKKVRVDKN